MVLKIAINGHGRIGRNALRALYERSELEAVRIVAINDLASNELNAHLTEFDTTHGRFPGEVTISDGALIVNGDAIKVLSEREPDKLPWGELDIDVVLECTGRFTGRKAASGHLSAGAKRVIISAPAGADIDATIVHGVNDDVLRAEHRIIAIGSCTTNCLAVVAKPLDETIGIIAGNMTTVHAVTNDQVLTDVYHADPRRARSAIASIIPTKTGAASAIGLVLPELEGRLDGYSIRVPTIDVCLLIVSFMCGRATSVDEINMLMRTVANKKSLGRLLTLNDLPLVSSDFTHNSASAIFDTTLTKVTGDGMHATVHAWYDNEWGFANRLIDNAIRFGGLPLTAA